MKPKRILILGAGGNSLSIADAIVNINAASATGARYELLGFLDDLPEKRGRSVLGFPVLGTISDAPRWPDCRFICGIASEDSFRKKAEVIARSGIPQERFETIAHPGAVIAHSARIGAGCAILANSVIGPEVTVGDHVIMLQNSTVDHHVRLGHLATLSAGVTVLGFADVGDGAFLGGGVSVAPRMKIGAGALVGLGATVIRDVAPGTVVVGNPAREISSSPYAAAPKR